MKCAIICCLLLFLCSESQTLENNLHRCVSPDKKSVMFSCLRQSELGTNQWNCENKYNSSAEQPNYKCYSKEYREFILNDRILEDHLHPERFDVAELEIKRFTESSSFHSDTITTFNARKNQLNNISSSISMPKLKKIDLSNNNFSSLTAGEGIFGHFPQLARLDLSFNSISTIEKEHFRKYNKLEWLNLSNNQITKLPYHLFQILKSITEIDFSSNHIDDLLSDFFERADKLTKINFSNNSIESLNAISKVRTLEYLDMSQNKIQLKTTFFDTPFWNNADLKYLNLSDNQLSSLSRRTFEGASKLTEINVSHNGIHSIPSGIFSKLEDLQTINLSGNQINKISDNTFANNSKLLSLNLRSNPLKGFNSNAFPESSILEKLDLSNTSIETLSSDMLQKFKDLNEINLRNAIETKIEQDVFRHQTKLNWLDISENNLKNLASVFGTTNFNNLEILYSENNGLSSVDIITKDRFPKLRKLAISGNNFTCGYLRTFLSKYDENQLKVIKNEKEVPFDTNEIGCREEITTPAPTTTTTRTTKKTTTTTRRTTTTTTTTTKKQTTKTTAVPMPKRSSTPTKKTTDHMTTSSKDATSTIQLIPTSKAIPIITQSTELSIPTIDTTESSTIESTEKIEVITTEQTLMESPGVSEETTPTEHDPNTPEDTSAPIPIIIAGILVLVFLCVIAALSFWYFHRKTSSNGRNSPVDPDYNASMYYEQIYEEPIDEKPAYENIQVINENAEPHNNRAQVHQGDEDELTYEQMYVTQEQIEMNIMKQELQNDQNNQNQLGNQSYDHLEFPTE